MKFNASALAMAAVLSAGATSTVTLAFAPSSSANHHLPSLAVSSFGRPAFVAQRQSPSSDEFILHMVGGGKDEEAAENLNEYKKNISSKRITEASGKSGEVRTLLLRRTHFAAIIIMHAIHKLTPPLFSLYLYVES